MTDTFQEKEGGGWAEWISVSFFPQPTENLHKRRRFWSGGLRPESVGWKKKRLFPFKKRPQFAFQSPASSFRSSPPARNQTQTDPMWCCLTLCYKLLSRSDTQTHILTQSRCREWDTPPPPPPQLQKQKKLKWHSGKKKKKKEEGICGLLFWLVGQMPQRWVKKENMQRLPCRFPCVGWREKESPQQIYGGGKRCLAPTAANLRLGGSAVALLQLRANSHTLKRRRADSSRPLER